MTLRVTSFRRAEALGETPFDIVVMDADERHLRRRPISLQHGGELFVDFEKSVKLEHGNRHLPAQIEAARILIRRDRIIRQMLETLGATVTDVSEAFHPEHGAYHGHEH